MARDQKSYGTTMPSAEGKARGNEMDALAAKHLFGMDDVSKEEFYRAIGDLNVCPCVVGFFGEGRNLCVLTLKGPSGAIIGATISDGHQILPTRYALTKGGLS